MLRAYTTIARAAEAPSEWTTQPAVLVRRTRVPVAVLRLTDGAVFVSLGIAPTMPPLARASRVDSRAAGAGADPLRVVPAVRRACRQRGRGDSGLFDGRTQSRLIVGGRDPSLGHRLASGFRCRKVREFLGHEAGVGKDECRDQKDQGRQHSLEHLASSFW